MTVTHVKFAGEPDSRVLELLAELDAAVADAIAVRSRYVADRDDRHAALAIALTPEQYRCRLEWVEQDGIRGRVMSCRWGR